MKGRMDLMADDKKNKVGKVGNGDTVGVDNDQLGENADANDTLYAGTTDRAKEIKTKGQVNK